MSKKRKHAEQQPKDGDTVYHCGHMEEPSWHWFYADAPISGLSPAGEVVLAHWIVACKPCFVRANGDALGIQVRGHGTWKGNAPSIYAPGDESS